MPSTGQSKKYEDLLTAFPYGINSGIAPLLLPKEQCSFAINTTFRGGYATDRPVREKLTLDFGGDAALETAVRSGFFQGAGVYRPDFGASQVVAQISGRLFTFTESGSDWLVAEITIAGDANDATTSQVWMWQAEKWLIISDGSSRLPIFYDGVSCRRSYGPAQTLGTTVALGNFPTPRVIGEIVTVTLVAPWEHPAGTSGPFNVPVRFNGAYYQPSSTSATGYSVDLTNIDATAGATVQDGSSIVVRPGVYGKVLSVISNSAVEQSVCSFPIDPQNVHAGSPHVFYFEAMISVLRQTAIQMIAAGNITIEGSTSWTVAGGDDPNTNPNPTLNIRLVKTGACYWIPPGAQPLAAGSFIYPSSNPTPDYIVGTTLLDFVNPAVGATVSAIITSPYVGPDDQLVWIGTSSYTIRASPNPAPSTTLYLINLTDTTDAGAAIPAEDITSVPEIPACRMGAYGLGQNWFSSVDGLSFGPSDIVGASSGSQANNFRDAVLKTTDLDVMGTFKIPVAGEIITAMIFVATLDQALGQGPLQIGVPSGMFSCKAPFTLTDFQGITNSVTGDLVTAPIVSPILTKSLVGFGPIAQNSTILANSDTIFRSFEGINSLILARRNFSDIGGNTPMSREMSRIIDIDRKDLLSYSSAIVFDNRLRMTTSPNVSGQGVFHMGELVLNYDLISSLRGKAQPVWDGLWTGNNILQYIQGLFGPESRAFAFTFNITDEQIELYEFLKAGDTYLDNGSERIKWVIETPIIFNADVKTLTDVARLIDGEMYLSDVNGAVDVVVLYRPLFYPCWRPWHTFKICANMTATNAKQQVRYALGFGEPDPKDCDTINDQPFREAVGFQLRLEITGHCKLWGVRALGDPVPSAAFSKPAGTCTDVDAVCLPLDCDVEDDLEVYSLDGLPAQPLPAPTATQPNDAVFNFVTDSCPAGTTLSVVGTPLPSWISFNSAGAYFQGAFGTYYAETSAEATATAQSELDAFVATVIANGSLTCFGTPILESTITGLGGALPSQIAWDSDNETIWIASGYNGDIAGRTVRYKISDGSIATLAPANDVYGIQYVPAVPGAAIQDQRMWINRYGAIGHILPTSPYTITDVFSPLGSTMSTSFANPALWIPEKNMFFASQGVVAFKLRLERVDFITGLRTESDLVGITLDANQYTYNPEANEIFIGGFARVDVDTLVPSTIALAGGRTACPCAAYCPDNGHIYIPYLSGSTYGVALMNATTHVIDPTYGYVDVGPAAITGIVYHSARKFMYLYGQTTVSLLDAMQPLTAPQVIAGTVAGITTGIANATAVYCPTNYRVYIGITGGQMYVIT